ncbi:MAG: tetratricopeptide repeat protein [Halofilum sp. (in: g-proteobacteria)]
MVDYATEEEQVEALKRWWRENGKSIVAGAALGILALVGWRGWTWHQETQALEASRLYDQVTARIQDGDRDALVSVAERLRGDYGSTAYASFAALAAARAAVDAGEPDAATGWLRWAMENADDAQLEFLARGRLARAEAANGRLDEGLALLDVDPPSAWSGLFGEIRGDLLTEKGDREAAAEAYRAALDAEVPPPDPEAVQRKLNEVQAAGMDRGGDEEEAS